MILRLFAQLILGRVYYSLERRLIKAGCCGFAVKGGAKTYYKLFDVVELQSTFYRLPKIETAERWRREAPEWFEFVVKAWQAVTHPPTSPTWRHAGAVSHKWEMHHYGHLKPTPRNLEAWKKTLEICRQLHSKICVVQCPPSFVYNKENVGNMRRFFDKAPREDLAIAWEPRHKSWHDNPEFVKTLCTELDLVHVVDIFKRQPQSSRDIVYIRLHGLPKELSYKYSYVDKDLEILTERVKKLDVKQTYVMFNNMTMAKDCLRFMELLSKSPPSL